MEKMSWIVLIVSCMCFVHKGAAKIAMSVVPWNMYPLIGSDVVFQVNYTSTDINSMLTLKFNLNGTDIIADIIGEDVSTVTGPWVDQLKINSSQSGSPTAVTVTFTLSNVSSFDSGRYDLKIVGMDGTSETSIWIQPFAQPSWLDIIKLNNAMVDSGTVMTFQCTGNVGWPEGAIRLLRSSSGQPLKFYPMEIVIANCSAHQENGTCFLDHTFEWMVTENDHGSTFQCQVVHDIPPVPPEIRSITSGAVHLEVRSGGVIFTGPRALTENNKAEGASFLCEPSTPSITVVNSLQFSKKLVNGSDHGFVLTRYSIPDGASIVSWFDDDIHKRATANGSVYPVDESFISLQFSNTHCSDAAKYTCVINAVSGAGSLQLSATTSFTIFTDSGELQLSQEGPPYSQNAAGSVSVFPVGSTVVLKCHGNVGQPSQNIQWCIMRETDEDFGPYPNTADYVESGLVSASLSSCQKTQTSTLSYIVTEFDTLTTFKCFVNTIDSSSTCMDNLQSTSLKITNSASKGNIHSGGSEEPNVSVTNAGMIAGIVVAGVAGVVIIIIVVCVVVRKRKKAGRNYATKADISSISNSQSDEQHNNDTFAVARKDTINRALADENPFLGIHEKDKFHYVEVDVKLRPGNTPTTINRQDPPTPYADIRFV